MPRTAGIYNLPPGTAAVQGEVVDPVKFNTLTADVEADLNFLRPISAGGTGAGSAGSARTALGVPGLSTGETISGSWNFTSDLLLQDNIKVLLGSGLEMFHNGTDSKITNLTGDLDITIPTGQNFRVFSANGETIFSAFSNGGVILYYNNVAQLQSTNTGIVITGNMAVTGQATVADHAYAPDWNGNLEVPTKNAVYDKIVSLDNYTWQNMTPSRVAGTAYQNTSDAPIRVVIVSSSATGKDFSVSPDDITYQTIARLPGTGGVTTLGEFTIGVDEYYRMESGAVITRWMERRP